MTAEAAAEPAAPGGAQRLDAWSELLDALPQAHSTPELNVPCREGEPAEVVKRLQAEARFEGAREIVTIDGVRAEFDDGFALIRGSNTTPVLVLRFEGTTPKALARIEAQGMAELRAVNEALWDVEDDIRAMDARGDFGPAFVALARAVYRTNDRRAAIKRAVNDLTGSALVEVKSYESPGA